MLNLLKIKNVALIDSVEIEFGYGLNLLTGETGSGKSIIVDSLGALTGERVSVDLIKAGSDSAQIEGLFSHPKTDELSAVFDESGIEFGELDGGGLIVRREISSAGKNRIFVNNQLVTAAFLRKIAEFLVDIHGQGEHMALFDPATHLELLDQYARTAASLQWVGSAYREWSATKAELANLLQNESEKLQLLDILKFQADEIRKADLKAGEEEGLEEEKSRLNNVEKLSALSGETLQLLYDNDESTVATLEKAVRKIAELTDYESKFGDYSEGLQSAQAVLQDLSFAIREFRTHLEFSPERIEQIEQRLAEITRLKRKYGTSVEAVLEHYNQTSAKLDSIENAEFHQEEVRKRLGGLRLRYSAAASELHSERSKAASKFAKEVKASLSAVALEKAKFEVRIDSPSDSDLNNESFDARFTSDGFDRVEFYFSANAGEPAKPLAKVASGGEASRVMLILKTTAKEIGSGKSSVFDEIDAGIGGRVAEAVGLKLKELAKTQQVLCVTHQPQVASLADEHFVVEKTMTRQNTSITVRKLGADQRVDEIARMLAGETVTEAARENAREMLAAAG